ncbi:hypothetical protein RRG08_065638 [Elysia crispata]|uniref:Uncharacterized protein n=1 Tax=Elysia crispata TaxID=231223 RepID=A0AAE1D1K6_9GAST|nr:hypothetical protein RRG08_065638 [Elysia crispata]
MRDVSELRHRPAPDECLLRLVEPGISPRSRGSSFKVSVSVSAYSQGHKGHHNNNVLAVGESCLDLTLSFATLDKHDKCPEYQLTSSWTEIMLGLRCIYSLSLTVEGTDPVPLFS